MFILFMVNMSKFLINVKRLYVHIVYNVDFVHDFRMNEQAKENKTQHLHILMAPSEVEAIDEWGFANRIRTRGEAIRRLCQMGLTVDEHSLKLFEQATHGLRSYLQRSDEISDLFSDPHRPAKDVAVAAAEIMPALLLELKKLSLLSAKVAMGALPYSVTADFGDAQELSTLIKNATNAAEEIGEDADGG